MSKEQLNFLKKIKHNNRKVRIIQFIIISIFIFLWEYTTSKNIISSFIYSSPSKIIKTIYELIINHNFFNHIFTTIKEVLISFFIGNILGFIIAILLYEFKLLSKILDPFLTMLNSLPKIALGPLIIIIFGSNIKSIIIMALLINLIISIITIYNGFMNINPYEIKLFKTLHASKLQTLFMLVIPSSYYNIISSFKLSIAQTLVGVIMGEFLVSKEGIGYLIVYGKQVFNLNYVMTGIILLAILSYLLYKIVVIIENKLLKNSV